MVLSFVQGIKDKLQEIKREKYKGLEGFNLGIYTAMKRFVSQNRVEALFRKKIDAPESFTEQEIIILTVFTNLFKYIQSSFTLCPSCCNVM